MNTSVQLKISYEGNDRLLFSIIMGVIAFWLFAQTTLNIAPDLTHDLGMDVSMMNVAVAITTHKHDFCQPSYNLTSSLTELS